MNQRTRFISLTLGALLIAIGALVAPVSASAQQPQIPTLQVCNDSAAGGFGVVKLGNRADAAHSGSFQFRFKVGCDVPGYPSGIVELRIDMSDSTIQGSVRSTSIEQLTTTGKHTPTAYLNGRCEAQDVKGCRFWMMVVNNGLEQDVVGFLIMDGQGNRVAYGTGQLRTGSVSVAPTSY